MAEELEPLAQKVSTLVTELVLTEVNVPQGQLAVLEARADELLDSVHFDAVASHVEHLEADVLEEALAHGQHDLLADAAIGQRQVSQVLAAAEQ